MTLLFAYESGLFLTCRTIRRPRETYYVHAMLVMLSPEGRLLLRYRSGSPMVACFRQSHLISTLVQYNPQKGGVVMQVKVFSNKGDASKLEAEVNTWLKKNNNIEISHVRQSCAYDGEQAFYTLMSIWYTTVAPEKHIPI